MFLIFGYVIDMKLMVLSFHYCEIKYILFFIEFNVLFHNYERLIQLSRVVGTQVDQLRKESVIFLSIIIVACIAIFLNLIAFLVLVNTENLDLFMIIIKRKFNIGKGRLQQ